MKQGDSFVALVDIRLARHYSTEESGPEFTAVLRLNTAMMPHDIQKVVDNYCGVRYGIKTGRWEEEAELAQCEIYWNKLSPLETTTNLLQEGPQQINAAMELLRGRLPAGRDRVQISIE